MMVFSNSSFNSNDLSYCKGCELKFLVVSEFENSGQEELWIDPYNSIWMKILTVAIYVIEVVAAFVMFAFVAYETGGLAGNYRTVINQLLSYLYGAVCLFLCLSVSMDAFL